MHICLCLKTHSPVLIKQTALTWTSLFPQGSLSKDCGHAFVVVVVAVVVFFLPNLMLHCILISTTKDQLSSTDITPGTDLDAPSSFQKKMNSFTFCSSVIHERCFMCHHLSHYKLYFRLLHLFHCISFFINLICGKDACYWHCNINQLN